MDLQHQQNNNEQKQKVGRQHREKGAAPKTDCMSHSNDGDDYDGDDDNNKKNTKRVYKRFLVGSSFESADNCTTTDEDCSAAAPTDEERSVRYPQTTASSTASVPTDEEDYRMHKPYSSSFIVRPGPQNPSLLSPNRFKTPPRDQQQRSQNNSNNTSQETGGRLWRLAGEIAAGKAPSPLLGKSPNTKANLGRLRESFMERMRSRADPDALVTPPTPPRPDPRSAQVMIVKMTDSFSDDNRQEEEAFLINTGLAHKRVRVVQLLIIGLVSLLLGWLGNFFVSSSCYFASVPVQVGENGDIFQLHFGLWNYSPVDSALNGFKYCYPYGGQHEGDAPVVSRVVNLAALLAGTYSLVVLWWYLISGRVNATFWKAAVYSAVAAGALQFATPIFFFAGSMCRTSSCSAGPGSALSAVTAVAWVVLGAELHYQCPVVENDTMGRQPDLALRKEGSTNGSESSTPVANLEMADLAGASQEYLDRFQRKRPHGRYRPPEFA